MAAPKSPISGAFNETSPTISKCYICNKDIICEDIYNEHIILNSLGGRLKSKSLICEPCSVSVHKIDTALSKSLNLFGLLLDIKRDRKTNPSIKVTRSDTGEEIFLHSGGKPGLTDKPLIKDKLDDNEQPFSHVRTSNKSQMRKVLTGLKRKKYPSLNVEEKVNSAVLQQEKIPRVHTKILFGDQELRSVCKMAINFYMYHGGKRDLIAHLIPYIQNRCENQCVNYYYPDELIATPNLSGTFIHTLFIKGNPQEKLLYGYIELYNAFRLIVLLSDSYEETSFQEIYSFDVLSRREVDKKININISRKELLDLVNNSEPPLEKIVIAIKDLQKAIEGDIAIKDILKNISEGADVGEKMSQQSIAKKLSKGIWDFMSRGGK